MVVKDKKQEKTTKIKHNIDWSKSPNGVMLCTFEQTRKLMPEVNPILDEVIPMLEMPEDNYLIDIKVHMLMPKQWPCIPNWHCDFLPRDEDGNRIRKKASPLKMYMWLSGAPLTEYRNSETGEVYKKPPQQWHTFTQYDLHRGTMSNEHTWRCFIRIIPKEFVHPNTKNVGTLRIHTQVYADASNFKW